LRRPAAEYYENVRMGRGGLFIAVCRGKVSSAGRLACRSAGARLPGAGLQPLRSRRQVGPWESLPSSTTLRISHG
jgi:hypothetical protein